LMVNLGGVHLALAVETPFREYVPTERNAGGWFIRRKHNTNTVNPSSLTVEQAFGLDKK